MDTARSLSLFLAAALAEIGGAWLVWQGVREHRGWLWIGAGVIALGIYGFVSTLLLPHDPEKRAEKWAGGAAVTIGDNAWIGAGAVISPGVTIGAHAVVEAGAVVVSDVATGTLVAGNPAKVIARR